MAVGATDLSEYTIVPANRGQLEQHAKIAFIHWHHDKPFEQFLGGTLKEHNECEWGKDGRHEVWYVTEPRDWEPLRVGYWSDGMICLGRFMPVARYQRNALIRRQGQTEVEDAWMYAIASVVTSPIHLRQGLATHLLRLFHYVLAEPTHLPPFPTQWGAPPPVLNDPTEMKRRNLGNGIASILFSDVGYKFYEKCTIGLSRPGWKVRLEENTELVWDILPSNPDPAVSSSPDATSWDWITAEQLPAVRSEITERVRSKLEKLDTDAHKSFWQCDPSSPGVLTWLATRGPWLGSVRPLSPPPLGVKMHNEDGTDTIVLFTVYNEHVGGRLLVTHITNLRPEHLPSLLGMLDHAAQEAGREQGWIWGLKEDDRLVRAWKEVPGRSVRVGSRKEMNGHLLGVAWYGPEQEPAELIDRQIWHWC